MFITFKELKFLSTTSNTLFLYTLHLPDYKASPLWYSMRKIPTENMFNSVHNYKVTLHISYDYSGKKFLTYTQVNTVLLFIPLTSNFKIPDPSSWSFSDHCVFRKWEGASVVKSTLHIYKELLQANHTKMLPTGPSTIDLLLQFTVTLYFEELRKYKFYVKLVTPNPVSYSHHACCYLL